MCNVMDIEKCEKKIFLYLKDGRCVCTNWFKDDERKSSTMDFFTKEELINVEETLKTNEIEKENVSHWCVSRNKSDEDCVYISRHAFERMKQRNGWNKKTALRMVKKVYDNGVEPEQAPVEYRTWLRKKQKKEPETTYKMYGEMVYVFNNRVLITIMQANKFKSNDKKQEKIFID